MRKSVIERLVSEHFAITRTYFYQLHEIRYDPNRLCHFLEISRISLSDMGVPDAPVTWLSVEY